MRAAPEAWPGLAWGRPWSALVPGRLRYRLDRLAARHTYRRAPPPVYRFRDDPPAVRLLLTGDIALHRWPDGDTPARVFGGVRPIFEAADYRVVNLESALTARTEQSGRIGTFLRAAPARSDCLEYLHVDAASSANNHALDFGPAGLAECGEHLGRAGIAWCGVARAGQDPDGAGVLVREVNGVRIALLAATDHCGGAPEPGEYAPVWLDPARLRQQVRGLRAQCDVIVVLLHWGYEYVVFPLYWHRELARALAADGADLVVCHHAHVPMGMETRGKGLIAYGLGNCYFGTRSLHHPLWQHGILLAAGLDRHGLVSCEPVFVHTDGTGALQAEASACPGFHRMCARLVDDSLLARSERAQTGAALAQLVRELEGRSARGDAAGLRERQAFLRAPRQEWLLRDAQRSRERARREAGAWLESFRDLPAGDIQRLAVPRAPDVRRLARLEDTRFQPGRWP